MRIDALGSITQVPGDRGEVVRGKRIDLVSRTGGIGTSDQPLVIWAGNTEQAGLNASAAGDINIRQYYGDLHLIRVESTGGDVTLEVAAGSFVDANPESERDTRAEEELLKLWDEMLLVGEGAEESKENTIKAYKQAKEHEYQRYWTYYRKARPHYDENGRFLGYIWEDYDPGHPDLEYHSLHEAYGSLNGGRYEPDWEYIVTPEEEEEITRGYRRNEDQLRYSLSGLGFKKTPSTETDIQQPNVIGHNITLRALAGSIGTDDGYLVIDGNDENALKDDENRLALAAAEWDDLSIDENNQITVLKRKAVYIRATGEVTAVARDHVYLGSEQSIKVKSVSGGDLIRIAGKDGIYTVETVPAIQGGRTILEGGSEAIGTADSPLIIDLLDRAALTARAGQATYIREYEGDMHVAEIFSYGDVHLFAKGSILDARGDRPLTIMGHGVNLISDTGSIGTEADQLVVSISP